MKSKNPTEATSELAEMRSALRQARAEIDREVERRQQIEQSFEKMMTEDRERLRKQLHDGLGQVLTNICFLAHSLRAKLAPQAIKDTPELDEIVSLVNEAIAESRAIAAHCEPKNRGATMIQ